MCDNIKMNHKGIGCWKVNMTGFYEIWCFQGIEG
jgi:hypothetical protein